MQRRIHFDHELIEQEDLDGVIERRDLRKVGQSLGQAHTGVGGDHRAWYDNQSMEGDDNARQSFRVREPPDHLHEARSLGHNRVGDRPVASGGVQRAPQMTARCATPAEQAETEPGGDSGDCRGPILGLRPSGKRLPRNAPSIFQAAA